MDTMGLAVLLEALNSPCECEGRPRKRRWAEHKYGDMIAPQYKEQCAENPLERWWQAPPSHEIDHMFVNTNRVA